MPKIRGSRDTRDWADEFNNEDTPASDPGCPGCFWDPAPWGSYPPSLKGTDWWCSPCMNEKIQRLRHATN